MVIKQNLYEALSCLAAKRQGIAHNYTCAARHETSNLDKDANREHGPDRVERKYIRF